MLTYAQIATQLAPSLDNTDAITRGEFVKSKIISHTLTEHLSFLLTINVLSKQKLSYLKSAPFSGLQAGLTFSILIYHYDTISPNDLDNNVSGH